ncbi:GtrA-like protein [Clostridium tepidiprofundi DSM 19306]|uniref:GtrA-like protein n=1 Tax=Clostridium tepidiprofundi DSM 19306 TaxID=1121338 RepID=A0A151B4Q0_9CLOT|nr:GtrA family protein [Clostridium tepidiprofundi]KYH34770.1 GtrA-like protein [Clostridium tepidiprofundi DSM 19306]
MDNNKNIFSTIFQFIKYGIIGGLNFLIDFSVVKVLSLLTGVTSGLILSLFNLVSFFLYSINGYILNRKFTFKTEGNKKSYIKYASVLGIAMIANSIILIALTSKNPLIKPSLSSEQIEILNNRWLSISKLIASMTTGVFSFLINKFFVFNKK